MIRPRPGVTAILLPLAVALAALLGYAFCIEPNRLVPRQIALDCPGLREGPVRILFFSDVDFREVGPLERALREEAFRFQPDLVLVGGDFLDRPSFVRDPAMARSALDYLASLPAPAGRFLAPGEAELAALDPLRRAWPPEVVAVLANEVRRVRVRDETLDLFVAAPRLDPAPWSLSSEGDRTFVASRGRPMDRLLTYRGAAATEWEDAEVTLAFQGLDPESQIEVRIGWREIGPPARGEGWRLVRHEVLPTIRLVPSFREAREVLGRQDSGFLPPVGRWCRARIRLARQADVTRVRARFWLEGSPEPSEWSVDAISSHHPGDRGGTIALGAGPGRRRYADLRVVDGEGRLLLEEPFRDPSILRARWDYPSALADWLTAPHDGVARLLLAHSPDVVLDIEDIGAAPCVVLAGHTHGGQVRLPGVGALFTDTRLGRRYDAGLFDVGGTRLYITRGVGTSILRARFLSPPEVTLLTLVPAR